MDNKVLAVVAGEEVTEKDLNDFMENVPQEQQAYCDDPQFRRQCLEQLIALRMFTRLGEDEKLDETEEFKKIMEGARKDILAQMMISMTIKDIDVTEEEAERYYKANKAQFDHLIKVEGKDGAKETSYSDIKETVKASLLQQKQNAAYNAKVKELKEKYVQKQ